MLGEMVPDLLRFGTAGGNVVRSPATCPRCNSIVPRLEEPRQRWSLAFPYGSCGPSNRADSNSRPVTSVDNLCYSPFDSLVSRVLPSVEVPARRVTANLPSLLVLLEDPGPQALKLPLLTDDPRCVPERS